MDWSSFTFDRTINIESLIASIGVIGAALGYILNLIKNWKRESADRKYRGTNSFILDMLETNFYSGMSEDKLWETYNAPSTSEKRKTFGAWKPEKLKKLGFEGQLRHLQSKFLIRLTGNNHYHIDFVDQDRWHSEERRQKIIQFKAKLMDKLGTEQYNQILNSQLSGSDSSYSRREFLIALLRLDHENGIDKLISDLQSNDKDKIEAAVSIINKMFDSRL